MNKIVLTFEDKTTHEIDCSGVAVSAYTNWYGSERRTDDSINLSIAHKEDDVVLKLRQVIDAINNRAIAEVSWMRDDKEVMALSGEINPSWSLNSLDDLTEMLNFTLAE